MKLRIYVLFVIFGLTFSCSRKPDMGQPHVTLAERFARALADGRFDEAHTLLTDEQKKLLTGAALKKRYEEMISYGPGPSKHVEVMQTLDVWPDKKEGRCRLGICRDCRR